MTADRAGPSDREGPDHVVRGRRVDAPLVFPRLPGEVPFGFVGRVLPTSEPAELRLQVHRIPVTRALALLSGAEAVAEAELFTGDDREGAHRSQLELEAESAHLLSRRVAAREQELWRVGLSVHAVAPTPAAARRRRTEIVRRFRALGFRPRAPEFESAWAAGPPDLAGTERRPTGYWHTLHSDGVAAFFPYVDEAVLEPGGVLIGLLLDDASPVFLERWSQASHSWGVFGATGSGKTFFTAMTVLRSLWQRPGLEVFLVDPLGEFPGLARALGGTVLPLGDSTQGRLNPLDPVSANGDRAEKAGRVAAILKALFPSLRDEEGAVLDAALERLYTAGPGVPVLGDLLAAVEAAPGPSGRLRSLLEVFASGSLRHLNGPTTVDWGASPTVVTLTGVPEAHLPFHLAYVLDAVYGRIASTPGPKLLVVDEAHLLARDPVTAAFLDRLVRHVRHFSAGVVLVSQNPDDFLGTETGRSLLRNLRATLLLRLPEVSSAARQFFALTPAEADWLPRARLPREAGYSEGLLRSGPSHLPLALIASTPEYEFLSAALAGTSAVREP